MAINPDRVKKAFDSISSGDLKTLQLMVRAGVPTNYFQPDKSSSLLSQAARYGQSEIFQWLVDNGADSTFRESCSWREKTTSLLECACGPFGSLAIVSWLLQNTVPAQQDLDDAVRVVRPNSEKAIPLSQTLRDAGADVYSVDECNENVLFNAVCESAEDVAILMLNAGASPALRSKSIYAGEFARKTAYEVANKQGLVRFCEKCLRLHPELGNKPARISKPKTTEQCLEIINKHLSKYQVPLAAGLPDAREQMKSSFDLGEADLTDSLQVLALSWKLHNGSDSVGIFPVRDERAYLFMSLEDSIEDRKILMEVDAIDSPSEPSVWQSRIPIAENCVGDYLVIKIEDDGDYSVSHFSHETRRFRKHAKNFFELLQRTAVEIMREKLGYDPFENSLT